ncbi:LysR family transcriptional regulator [Thaumasiovibrio subtropicus]|uniref:LysR family transcriptional regulator n=1 Tax=Thaumasiovibrio subtropicus TaxID=1891207 RepID=UPI000B34EB95|nr:LysR family transcriptional regulator [Thaumasiovibrio subtropicus]
MDKSAISAFCQLASDGNYRVAADHLCLTQSALTKKILKLEETLGVTLFERGRHGAKLTQAGQMLIPEAEKILRSYTHFESLATHLANGYSGSLNIGFGISTYLRAPEYIAQFKKVFPEVHIRLNDMPSSVQMVKLKEGELNVSFNRLDQASSPLKTRKLFTDHLVVAVHREAEVDEKHLWESLTKLDFIQINPERGKGLHQQISRYLFAQNQSPEVAQEADDILTLVALVSSKLGYTILPASSKEICRDCVRLVPLSGAHASWDVGVIWNEATDSRVVDHFVDFVSGVDSKQAE